MFHCTFIILISNPLILLYKHCEQQEKMAFLPFYMFLWYSQCHLLVNYWTFANSGVKITIIVLPLEFFFKFFPAWWTHLTVKSFVNQVIKFKGTLSWEERRIMWKETLFKLSVQITCEIQYIIILQKRGFNEMKKVHKF